jgi:beta-lactamase superfamily II metal-dependent hydrolase
MVIKQAGTAPKRRVAIQTILFLLCLSLPVALPASPQPFRASFIDVGYGDAVLLEFPGGEKVLVDSGTPGAAPAVAGVLAQKGIAELDICIGTHTHIDHIGGFPLILKKIKANQFFLNRAVEPGEEPAPFISWLTERTPPYRVLKRGDRIDFADGSFMKCLHPGQLSGDLNRDSLALLVESRGCRLLLMGDTVKPSEEEMLRYGEPADLAGVMVLKVGHHGWGDVSHEAFLDAVSPGIAVISTGPSRWPRPPAWILDRFRRRDVPVIRTDRLGTIELQCDGGTMQVKAGQKVVGRYRVNQRTE